MISGNEQAGGTGGQRREMVERALVRSMAGTGTVGGTGVLEALEDLVDWSENGQVRRLRFRVVPIPR